MRKSKMYIKTGYQSGKPPGIQSHLVSGKSNKVVIWMEHMDDPKAESICDFAI